MTVRPLFGGVAVVIAAVAAFIGGAPGLIYVAAFVAATLPGWPLGRMLFGRRHPAAWIAAGLLGYGLTALALWLPIAMRAASWPTFLVAWSAMCAAAYAIWSCWGAADPLVPLPAWHRDSSLALAGVVLLVPCLLALPDAHLGQRDAEGGRRYRAYFTADFIWHEALTAELARFDSPPRNPYMASEPLHYYWAYFVLPAAITGSTTSRGDSPPIESYLKVNALCTGVLFIGAIFLAAWAAIPRPALVALAVTVTVVAASAEGLYSIVDLTRRNVPLAALRGLNIDAVTSWFFAGLTVDGLPRALWYGPQHACASALGLLALVVAARLGRQMTAGAAAYAGLALGLALMMSPFTAGVMTLSYAAVILWDAAAALRSLGRVVLVQCAAVVFVGLALGWCVWNGTFEGAGSAVELGLSSAAMHRPLTILGLALGPVLVPTVMGLIVVAAHRFPREFRPAVVGVLASGLLFFFVTLVLEPIWIGWRAGQQFLVTAPALVASALAALYDRAGRVATGVFVGLVVGVGLPTTIIDAYNAQDTSNLAMGPGFRWTVRLSAGEQEALAWIEKTTAASARVQMSLEPRGRETWSLIPTFARRRMAAGLPISLLRTPEYAAVAARADRMFATPDAAEAASIARSLNIDYIYVGEVERRAFGASVAKFADRHDLFGTVFMNGDSAVYAVY